MLAILISGIVAVISFINGPLAIHHGAPFSLENAAASLIFLISFVVLITKVLEPKSPREIFNDRRF